MLSKHSLSCSICLPLILMTFSCIIAYDSIGVIAVQSMFIISISSSLISNYYFWLLRCRMLWKVFGEMINVSLLKLLLIYFLFVFLHLEISSNLPHPPSTQNASEGWSQSCGLRLGRRRWKTELWSRKRAVKEGRTEWDTWRLRHLLDSLFPDGKSSAATSVISMRIIVLWHWNMSHQW